MKNVSQKAYWVGVISIAVTAFGFGLLYPYSKPNPINQPLVESQRSRASGFTMCGDCSIQKDATGKPLVSARMYATGPMHDQEVIRMEGMFTLITPDGKEQSFGPSTYTFGENLLASLAIPQVPAGSKVKISGRVYIYHREEIKSEREMMSDGGVRLYMNTGTVSFHKVPNSNPAKIEVDCENLGVVHKHGLELMALDKKTVSNRILLAPGKQLIERENLPYLGRQLGMEPYIIRQLIPWRDEPIELVVPIRGS